MTASPTPKAEANIHGDPSLVLRVTGWPADVRRVVVDADGTLRVAAAGAEKEA